MALRLRRGTNAERQTVTFADGELVYVTDHVAEGVSPVWVGDGTTVGGRPVDTSNDPGATALGDLNDVADTVATDGQVLGWNDANSNWEPKDAATPDLSSAVISDLSDVAIGIINTGQGLVWNGTNFEPGDLGLSSTAVISDLSDVVIGEDSSAPTDGQLLTWNETASYWEAQDAPALNLSSAVISDLSDVAIGVINTGQILVWNGTNFEPGDQANGGLVAESLPTLSTQLDANNNNIINANIINAVSFNGNHLGTHSGDFSGDFIGTFQGDIFADDSSVMYDSLTDTITVSEVNATTFLGTLTGDVTGDVTGNVTGNVTGGVTGGVTGDLKGSVFGDDSTLIIDGINNTVTAESLTTDAIVVPNTLISVGRPTGITEFRLESYQTRNRLNINTTDKTGDLSSYTGYYGTLNFGYQDSTTDRSDATIRGARADMRMAHDTVTDFISDETKYFTLKEGNFGFGTYTPAAKLDVRGEVMFGSFTTTERDALTPSNGTVIYNSTTDKFQGYAGGTWVDLH